MAAQGPQATVSPSESPKRSVQCRPTRTTGYSSHAMVGKIPTFYLQEGPACSRVGKGRLASVGAQAELVAEAHGM